ncbi:glycosyl hydrolase family 92-domain-containing protein [Penicillium malachiteum]|uniref:glycosyl hydrolase family 92-domain-containing protein n=1 Tax=Penicillium malachiteum TaxID=1324776 RepID=UPI0025468CFF|nr:glycosyl hydrolase family 92-domain-containing protein [Penicillium malachiteum]KAJ5713024.1 glycosyl hydrolase family 92-domain-containing protein [Penicillium malachiteum]
MKHAKMLTGVVLMAAAAAEDLTQHVDVFMGTENGGNDFPGAVRPFGMVKLGPDLYLSGTDAYSGYLPDGNFSGFSMMHEQGTGGAPKYGTVSQLPLIGNITDPLSNITVSRSGTDTGSVGYYKAETGDGVEVELSASKRAGIYRYNFPSGSTGNVLVDVSHVLPSSRGQGLSQHYRGGNITVFSDGHYEGAGIYDNGWNEAPDWTIYFCGYFDSTATSNKTYTATGADTSVEQDNGFASSSSNYTRIGALFSFSDSEVISRVGISWISPEKACNNVKSEIPEDTEFESVVDDAVDEWNTEVLSKITTTNTNETSLTLLYTSLYFMHLIPTNQTGENPYWSSSEPYYQDIFTFWDLFRCSTALMQVLQPTSYEEQIRSLIDIWRNVGYMPDARSSNYNGRSQGGSNADNVLADAYVKGVRGSVNWEDGYKAMVKDAEVTPVNYPIDWMAPDSSTHDGRSALPDWLEYGYITPNFSRAVSRAVEYAYNDFGLYQVASGLGKTDDAEKYLNRSRNWRNHWNPEVTSLGYSGFVVPRNTTGFVETDPLTDSGYWGDPYYEASSWAYSFADVHDMGHMIELMGGNETVVSRLDTMFTEGASGSSGTIFDPTNEPMFNLPYLYNFVGRQDLAVSRSRKVAKEDYTTGVSGLPGNSDAGAMQTWLLWNMIGLYPITGQTTFLIHSPWFESMTIDLGGNKTLQITSTGGDGNGDSDIYVQSLKVNGQAWTNNWLTWDDIFAEGGTLEFELGATAVNWTTGALPPSPAS